MLLLAHWHADYNVDDLYPLHVHIRYPVKVVTACTARARMMNTLDDVSRHRYHTCIDLQKFSSVGNGHQKHKYDSTLPYACQQSQGYFA